MIINHIAMKISSDLVAPLSEGVLNYFQPFNRGNLSISGRSNKAATLIEAEAAAAAVAAVAVWAERAAVAAAQSRQTD